MHRTAPLPVVVLCLGHGGCVCAQWLTACRHCSGRARGRRKTKSTVGCSTAKRQSLPDFWRALLCPVGERRTPVDSRSRAVVACRFTGNADGSHRQHRLAPHWPAAGSTQALHCGLAQETGRSFRDSIRWQCCSTPRRSSAAASTPLVDGVVSPTAAALPYSPQCTMRAGIPLRATRQAPHSVGTASVRRATYLLFVGFLPRSSHSSRSRCRCTD
jgi:hypothetical protein